MRDSSWPGTAAEVLASDPGDDDSRPGLCETAPVEPTTYKVKALDESSWPAFIVEGASSPTPLPLPWA